MQESLFREEAMDKMSSPDELDRLMRATDPKGGLALIALLTLVAATIVWGVFGSVPVQVSGDKGILLGGDSRSQAGSNPGGAPTDGGGAQNGPRTSRASPRSRWTRPGKRRVWPGVSFRAEHTRN